MRILVPLAILLAPALANHADKYSVREVGFTDLETKPYRIIMVAKDLKAPDVKNQHAALLKEIKDANVTLHLFAAADKTLAKELKPVTPPEPEKVTKPLFWVATDDRISSLEPMRSLADLLSSPLRKDIFEKVTHSLGVVVLIESKDEKANDAAKEKVEHVLRQVKEVSGQFDKASDHDVELLVLKLGARNAERWTLWALGEKEEAGDKPKVAVLYGKMRRAGPLLEGIEWKNEELFKRIAILAQTWDGDVRTIIPGPALPYVWTDWVAHLDLPFDPVKETPKIKAILDRPPVRNPEARKLRYEDYHKPRQEWHDPVPMPAPEPKLAPPEEPLMSTTPVAIVFLIIGVVGWLALGAVVWRLENRELPVLKPTPK